jgi:hypothetical protein
VNDDKAPTVLWTRRELIARVSAMLGGATLVGQAAMLAACSDDETASLPEPATGLFSASDIKLLDDIAETILPETDTPGAGAAGVGAFIAVMVNDAYAPDEQETFLAGLEALDALCKGEYGAVFADLDAAQQLAIAKRLDREQYDAMQNGEPAHYFRMLKELAVLGFFTSEVAYRDILEYAETPGRYDPCRPLDDSVRMMAGHGSSPYSN